MGVFSYNQRLHFGFIADSQAAPDITKFNAFLDDAFIELRQAANVQPAEHIEVKTVTRPRPNTAAAKSAAAKRASRKVPHIQWFQCPSRKRHHNQVVVASHLSFSLR